TGGVTPAPKPTPAKMIPFAIPRSEDGIHRATKELEAGYIMASPTPREKRMAIKYTRIHVQRGERIVTAEVKIPHHNPPKVRARRAPTRSARRPAGTWKRAYPRTNALNTQ